MTGLNIVPSVVHRKADEPVSKRTTGEKNGPSQFHVVYIVNLVTLCLGSQPVARPLL